MTSRCGALLLSLSADVVATDDVIAFEGHVAKRIRDGDVRAGRQRGFARWQNDASSVMSSDDDVATFLWACAVVEGDLWTSSPLIPTLIERVNAVQGTRTFSAAAVSQFYQSVHRFSQLGSLVPTTTGVASKHHQQRAKLVQQFKDNRTGKVSKVQQAVYNEAKVLLPDAESEVLLPDTMGGCYEVDIYSQQHNLVLEVDGIHHFVHAPASADSAVMVADQFLLWFSTVLEHGGAGGAGIDAGVGAGAGAGAVSVAGARKEVTVETLHAKLASSWDYNYFFTSTSRDALATPELLAAQLERCTWFADDGGGGGGGGGDSVYPDLKMAEKSTASYRMNALLSTWQFKSQPKQSARKTKGAQNHPVIPAPWAQREQLVGCTQHSSIRQTGASVLKTKVLAHAGIKVQSVPWFEYQHYAAQGKANEYLAALIDSALSAE